MTPPDATLQVNHVGSSKAQGRNITFLQFAERLFVTIETKQGILRVEHRSFARRSRPFLIWHGGCDRDATTKLKTYMNVPFIDDSRIETRFVWARCGAENARAMRDLIRAFQNDGWDGGRESASARKHSRRSSNK